MNILLYLYFNSILNYKYKTKENKTIPTTLVLQCDIFLLSFLPDIEFL